MRTVTHKCDVCGGLIQWGVNGGGVGIDKEANTAPIHKDTGHLHICTVCLIKVYRSAAKNVEVPTIYTRSAE